MPRMLESDFENMVLSVLEGLDFACMAGESFDPDASGGGASAGGSVLQEVPPAYGAGPTVERENYHGAILQGRFRAAVARINPTLPPRPSRQL